MPKVNMIFEFDSMEAAATFLAFHHGASQIPQTPPSPQQAANNYPVQTGENKVNPDLYAEARKAMTDYIQRGNGRTALTAKQIQEAHGLTGGIKGSTPEQLPALIAAYKSA